MKKILSFVALDLETTGLNPDTDTIIEIAAIKGDIIYKNNSFSIENISERSMLINPGKNLEEEVILITKITNEMIEKSPKWEDIKDKVKDFIGEDSVILGHNVLFDIAVLSNHGINLSNRNIIDTFELSEIFSQNAESLNLGFLGDFYGIQKRGQEHRALTDTWISVDLFCRYLEEIKNLPPSKKAIWNYYALHQKSPLSFLQNLLEKEKTINIDDIKKIHTIKKIENITPNKNIKKQNTTHFFSIENNSQSEIDLLKEQIQQHSKIRIITHNKKISNNLKYKLDEIGISAEIIHNPFDFIASEEVFNILETIQNPERKFYIFLLKLAFWILDTQTGLLQELKFYGKEYDYAHVFRLQNNESNIFKERHNEKIHNSTVQIETFSRETQETEIYTIFRDIALMEETVRKNTTEYVDFEKLISDIQKIENPHQKDFIDAVRTMEALYENMLNRPTGDQPSPPGKYGETYFLTQDKCWSKGCKWLGLTNRFLFEHFDDWKKFSQSHSSRMNQIIIENIIKKISLLVNFQTQPLPNTGIIVTILNEKMSIQFIDNCINEKAKKIFSQSDAYGFHLIAEGILDFIGREWEVDAHEIKNLTPLKGEQIIKFQKPGHINLSGKTLILTTSMKHIREIGSQLQGKIENIFLQGTSGGKSKMTHYFLDKKNKDSILIGLIDSWAYEPKIFQNINRIIIAKIPFDPPTDPHFLAKTSGMENNFENYSKPIVLSRLNSLIGTAFGENRNLEIICSDIRIESTEWGKFMKNNLF